MSTWISFFWRDYENRSIHQGFLREACDWGIQGLGLRLAILATAAMYVWNSLEARRRMADEAAAIWGISILSGIAALTITCLFGDMFHLEWSYWINDDCSIVRANLSGPPR